MARRSDRRESCVGGPLTHSCYTTCGDTAPIVPERTRVWVSGQLPATNISKRIIILSTSFGCILVACFQAYDGSAAILRTLQDQKVALETNLRDVKKQLEQTKTESGFYVQRHIPKGSQAIISGYSIDKAVKLTQIPIYVVTSSDNDSAYLGAQFVEVFRRSGLNAHPLGVSPQLPGEVGIVVYEANPEMPSIGATQLVDMLHLLDYAPKILKWDAVDRNGWRATDDFYLFVTRDTAAPN